MKYNYLSIFFLLIIVVSFLLIFAPVIDHIFYVDHKLKETSDFEIFLIVLVHIILLGVLIYIFHRYIVKKYMEYFKLTGPYIKIIDLILALTLTGLQRNLIFKLRYLSNKHPFRSKLII